MTKDRMDRHGSTEPFQVLIVSQIGRPRPNGGCRL